MPSPQLLEEFSQFFRLLSEQARLQLLCQLKHSGSMDVAGLIEATVFSQSHISRQLGQLQRAGLVSCERDGVRTIWSADNDLVDDLCNLWCRTGFGSAWRHSCRAWRPVEVAWTTPPTAPSADAPLKPLLG